MCKMCRKGQNVCGTNFSPFILRMKHSQNDDKQVVSCLDGEESHLISVPIACGYENVLQQWKDSGPRCGIKFPLICQKSLFTSLFIYICLKWSEYR